MAISDLARIQGLRLDAATASPRTLRTIKSNASDHVKSIKQVTTKSSAKTSNYTKGFARKAYTIQLSQNDTRYGPTYAKPR